jgi:hypothetical protein
MNENNKLEPITKPCTVADAARVLLASGEK